MLDSGHHPLPSDGGAPKRARRPAIRALAIALALWAASGCDGGNRDAPGAAQPAVTRPLGAVVFLLDTVRADHLGSYGYPRATTPAIDGVARRGVRFTQAVSYSSWTLPSVVAVLAGDYPARVLDDHLTMQRSLVETVARAGFRTAAFTESAYVSRRWGMDRGFDHYYETARETLVELSGSDIDGTFDAASQWITENGDRPFFLLIHTYEAHMPYDHHDFTGGMDPGRVGPSYELAFLQTVRKGDVELTAGEQEYIRALYDGDIRSTDRHVGKFLALLDTLGLSDRTLVVVMSDHGEELGEEFEAFIGGHGHSLRDNLLLVPLVLFDPTRQFPRREITTQVRTIDVLPTVADLLGVPVAPGVAGRSLVPVLAGEETAHRAAMSGDNRLGPARISIRDGEYKFIATIAPHTAYTNGSEAIVVPKSQLYDLAADPHEDVNLAGSERDVARRQARLLTRWFNALGKEKVEMRPEVVDERLRERLRALGYVE